MTDGRYVSFDRWDAEHQALAQRVEDLEHALQPTAADLREDTEHRRHRLWLLFVGLATCVIFPVITTAILTFLHLRSAH